MKQTAVFPFCRRQKKLRLPLKQLKLSADENSTPIAVVIDGKPWLLNISARKEIKNSKIELVVNNENKDIKDIMLLTIDEDGNTYI